MKQSTVFAFLVASAACGVQAAEIRPLIKAGVEFGGDTMATVTFDDGDTQKIRGNQGVYVGGGAAIIDAERNMEYHLTAASSSTSSTRITGTSSGRACRSKRSLSTGSSACGSAAA